MNPTFESKKKLELKAYPNPCTTSTLTFEFSSHRISEITISNIAGRVVLSKKIRFSENKVKLNMDLPHGVYISKVKTVSNQSITKKLIVSRR